MATSATRKTAPVTMLIRFANVIMAQGGSVDDLVTAILIELGAYAGRDSEGNFLVHERILKG